MLAWSWRGTDNGRQKTRNHGYDAGRAICRLPDHPRKLVTLNPKLNQQAPDAAWLLFPVGGMPTAQLGLKDFSPKVSDAVALQQRLRSVALYL